MMASNRSCQSGAIVPNTSWVSVAAYSDKISAEAILGLLKTHGPATLGEVAAYLEVSKQGALRHLEALEASGLARRTLRRPRRRRPTRRPLAGRWWPG